MDNDRRDELHERLEQLEQRIEVLEDDLASRRGERGPHYYESGAIQPEFDDQAIAP